MLDDVLQSATPAARQSIESLVYNLYGPESGAKYLEPMRTPKLPEGCIADDHWAKPLLYQYLRVLDNNPHYSPKQIETQVCVKRRYNGRVREKRLRRTLKTCKTLHVGRRRL